MNLMFEIMSLAITLSHIQNKSWTAMTLIFGQNQSVITPMRHNILNIYKVYYTKLSLYLMHNIVSYIVTRLYYV